MKYIAKCGDLIITNNSDHSYSITSDTMFSSINQASKIIYVHWLGNQRTSYPANLACMYIEEISDEELMQMLLK